MMTFLGFLASFVTISFGIYRLFDVASNTVKPEVKTNLSLWLQNLDTRINENVILSSFLGLFDDIFSKHHFSWDRIVNSIGATFITSFFVYLVLKILRPEFTITGDGDNSGVPDFLALAVSVYPNLIIDFFSLMITRLLLGRCLQIKSIWYLIPILLIDFILTSLLLIPLIVSLETESISFLSILKGYESAITLNPDTGLDFGGMTAIIFYTTFTTSIWLWLFILSAFILKLVNWMNNILTMSLKWLDVENRPLKSIGFFLVILITFVYLIWGIFLIGNSK